MPNFARVGSLLTSTSVVFLSGCASITGSTDQTISVQAKSAQGTVVEASCELDNDKGKWFVNSPGSTRISRSNEDLIVTCRDDDTTPGVVTVESRTKGSRAGNILFGGLIGVAIDHSSGAAYEYPTLIEVIMGRVAEITNLVIEDNNQTDSVLATP
ncbi:MAG TPA: hypothetical protein VIC30_11890 [Orrella sp.]